MSDRPIMLISNGGSLPSSGQMMGVAKSINRCEQAHGRQWTRVRVPVTHDYKTPAGDTFLFEQGAQPEETEAFDGGDVNDPNVLALALNDLYERYDGFTVQLGALWIAFIALAVFEVFQAYAG